MLVFFCCLFWIILICFNSATEIELGFPRVPISCVFFGASVIFRLTAWKDQDIVLLRCCPVKSWRMVQPLGFHQEVGGHDHGSWLGWVRDVVMSCSILMLVMCAIFVQNNSGSQWLVVVLYCASFSMDQFISSRRTWFFLFFFLRILKGTAPLLRFFVSYQALFCKDANVSQRINFIASAKINTDTHTIFQRAIRESPTYRRIDRFVWVVLYCDKVSILDF